jgi:hypothetical protein
VSSLKIIEDKRTRNTRDRGFGDGMLKGVIPNVTNDPAMEIAQMNRIIREMKNEITRLRRNENLLPNPRMIVQE